MDQKNAVEHLNKMPVCIFPRIGAWDGVVSASPVGIALLVALWRSHDTWVSGSGSFSDRWQTFWADMSSWRMRLLSLWARSAQLRLGSRFALPLDVARYAHDLGRNLPAIESWRCVEQVSDEVRPWFVHWERELVGRECLLDAWRLQWPDGVTTWPEVFEGFADRWMSSTISVDQLDQEVLQASKALVPLAAIKGVVIPDEMALIWSFRSLAAELVRRHERQVLLMETGLDELHLTQPLGV